MPTSAHLLSRNIGQLLDTHAHFFDPLERRGIVWPERSAAHYGRKRIEEYKEEMSRLDPVGVVAVETSRRECDDEYLRKASRRDKLIVGYVANLAPDTADFEQRLKEYCSDRAFKGIRLRPIDRFDLLSAEAASICDRVGRCGRVVEIGTNSPDRIPALFSLARRNVHTRFVLVHAGHPFTSSGEFSSRWTEAWEKEAPPENVWCTITTNFGRQATAAVEQDIIRQLPFIIQELTRVFSHERLLWGSNWPVASPRQAFDFLGMLKSELGGECFRKIAYSNGSTVFGSGVCVR